MNASFASLCLSIGLFLLIPFSGQSQSAYFFPGESAFRADIPTPEAFLGYPLGTHYTRHDQIVAYFRELDRLSDRLRVRAFGKTYEERPQIIATFTAPENFLRLEDIRQQHLQSLDVRRKEAPSASQPVVVLLGYSVHGNETSSGEAAMLTAYYFCASNNPETIQWLQQAVVFIDPSLNPDGRDRAANWHNSYKSFPPNPDPLDKEHQEIWPNGRSNHYLSNLNRDWLSATQIESQNRLEFFHQWYPNVQIDFHEMGSNSSYYFEPTPKRTESPLLPASSYDFNLTLARYHIAAMDKMGSLYFTKEQFDNLSPIYGSTYPDFFGAVGVTFEQGSSRGLVQESENGLLHFAFTIRNHVQTGLATVRGAVAEKAGLFQLQQNFFRTALAEGKMHPVKAYVFGDHRDQSLTNQFLELLLRHRLDVRPLQAPFRSGDQVFLPGQAFIVPSEQPFFYLVHSIFEETPTLGDSVYYDNTSWSLLHAAGIQYATVTEKQAVSAGEPLRAMPSVPTPVLGEPAGVAYLAHWTEYNASKALYFLLRHGVLVKNAHLPFQAKTNAGSQSFGYGSLVIPVARQSVTADSLHALVAEASRLSGVAFYSVSSAFSDGGIDLGSNNIRTIRTPEVAVIAGTGTNYEEVGQVWFLLNQQLNAPITLLDIEVAPRANLNRYNTLVLTSGNYSRLDKAFVARLKIWVAEGGTLILFKNAVEWAIRQELIHEKTKPEPDAPTTTERIDYARQSDTESARRINGGIFTADIDITHPLGFGLSRRQIVFTKNSQTILLPSQNKYATVAKYADNPYISGYVSEANKKKIAGTAAILVTQEGDGKIVSFADDPTYRSYWKGTDRLFLNALFLGHQIQMRSPAFAEEE